MGIIIFKMIKYIFIIELFDFVYIIIENNIRINNISRQSMNFFTF